MTTLVSCGVAKVCGGVGWGRGALAPYLRRKVDIGASVEQQLSHVQVFIMCSNVQRRKSSLGLEGIDQLIFKIIALHAYLCCPNTSDSGLRLCKSIVVIYWKFLNSYKCLMLKQLSHAELMTSSVPTLNKSYSGPLKNNFVNRSEKVALCCQDQNIKLYNGNSRFDIILPLAFCFYFHHCPQDICGLTVGFRSLQGRRSICFGSHVEQNYDICW